MSKPQVLVLFACVAALAVLGLALAPGADGPGSRAAGDEGAGGTQGQASLQRIEDLLAAILVEVRGDGAVTRTADGPTLRPAPPGRTSVAPEPRSVERPEDLVERHDELNAGGPMGRLLPEAVKDRLAPLDDWDTNERTRRQWLFTSERRALLWFGTPDHVYPLDASAEVWTYDGVDGREAERKLTFRRGRLTRID